MNHTIATIKRCTDHIRQNILHCMLLSNCSKQTLRNVILQRLRRTFYNDQSVSISEMHNNYKVAPPSHAEPAQGFSPRRVPLSSSAGSAMAAVKTLNPKAEVARAQAALAVNISAARGLQDVLRTNLGPKGTMKM